MGMAFKLTCQPVYIVCIVISFNSKLGLAILPILLFVCMAKSYCSNPLVCHCGTVPGPLHAPQLGSGAHSAGSITSGKTHHEVILAGIMGSVSMGNGSLFQCIGKHGCSCSKDGKAHTLPKHIQPTSVRWICSVWILPSHTAPCSSLPLCLLPPQGHWPPQQEAAALQDWLSSVICWFTFLCNTLGGISVWCQPDSRFLLHSTLLDSITHSVG